MTSVLRRIFRVKKWYKNKRSTNNATSALLQSSNSNQDDQPSPITFEQDDISGINSIHTTSNNNNNNNSLVNEDVNMADETTSLLKGDEPTRKTNGLSWSQSLMSSHSEEHNDITTAAFLLRDAIILSKATSLFAHTDYLVSTNPITSSGASMNGCSKVSRMILTNPFVTSLLSLSVISLVAISFLEPPTWCRDFQNTQDPSAEGGCKAALYMRGTPAFYIDDTETKSQYYYPSVRSDYLNAHQAFVVESVLVALLCLHTFLCIAKDGFSLRNYLMLNFKGEGVDTLTSKNMKNIRVFRIFRFVSLILLAKGLLLGQSSSALRPMAIFLRIFLFISYSEGVQRELMIAIEIIPSLLSVGVVLFMVIAFYGMIGVAAFYGTKEGDLYFSNWIEGIWTLWTSMTTVIYPDVMMAGYNENRFVALYFVTFMMFTFFFLLNVILAIVANGYNSSNEKREAEINETRENYLTFAFDLITKRTGLDYVTQDQVMGIFLVLNEECDEIA